MTAVRDRRHRPPAVKQERRGRPRRPDPEPALPPARGWFQAELFEARRDLTRWRPDQEHARTDDPWLAWARHSAHRLGEARGWPRKTRLNVDQALVIVLSGHAEGDVVRYSEIFPVLRSRGLSTVRTTEVLDAIGVFLDDRPASFERWLERKLDGLAVGIHHDVANWARILHEGGPRSQPRDATTVWNYVNRLRPVLLEWSNRYDHLREVTRDDVLAHLDTVHGQQRRSSLVALRSLFGRAKKNGTVFKNPTSRIRVGQQESGIIQPLEPEHVQSSVVAVTKPADRLILALAAVHAARTGAIRRLQLDDLDIGNRRLTVDGRVRPLDALTLRLALAWLEHRRRRWPDTANPHLLINKQTALETGPITGDSAAAALRGQAATLEKLRVDRQLEEALTHGPDPLHLAEVFGLDEKTAIRYANSARQLLEQSSEADTVASPRTHGSTPAQHSDRPAGSR
ncbi:MULTISPECIES: hypothetical protein [unclassified Streptomyces]|uniref:hypothetical protein n=1 Tax=unclassified Streptomyces TaxID=2593676 RepID=UPI002270C203|nr:MULTISPECIES: hypothetical protein [unclassified Streptomyces]MCY0924380.1 hypothetical protein [Streptomyces sp. H27-G5]MCY0963408.1 hypothetical protein [Streptomyces sp. H27-H5]